MEPKINSPSWQKQSIVNASEPKKEIKIEPSEIYPSSFTQETDGKSTKKSVERKVSIVKKHKKEEPLPPSYSELFHTQSYHERKKIYQNKFTVLFEITYNGNNYALKFPNIHPEYYDGIDNHLERIRISNEQIKDEIKALNILENKHDNIIDLLQQYEVKGQIPYKILVMPYSSQNFFYLFNQTRSFTISFCFDFAKQITSGLNFIHENGIVHGDIKPENILVFHKKGKLIFKIIDFGICFFHPYTTELFCVKHLMGSEQYRAPEFSMPDKDLCFYTNHSFDNYSLGVLIQKMVMYRPIYIGPKISTEQFIKLKNTLSESIKLAKKEDPLHRISAKTWNEMLHADL